MKQYLGIEPPTDTLGVLQDTHWSGGAFGYFPTYSLGAIFASQFYKAASKAIPDLNDKIKAGKFTELKSWLNKNIHEKGSLYTSGDELCKVVTGEPLNSKVYLEYITKKYHELYKL